MDPELLLSVGIGAVVGAGAKGPLPGQELTITELYDLMKAERGLQQGGGVLQGPKEVPGMSTSGADPYGIHRIAELVPFLEEDAVDILIERFTKEVQTLQAAPGPHAQAQGAAAGQAGRAGAEEARRAAAARGRQAQGWEV
ncbi:MAG: hypothetical protein IPO08_20215 [Xanthomonadales bacterium]|nr:hypothetical protein [Xanthomonadales bacterium]